MSEIGRFVPEVGPKGVELLPKIKLPMRWQCSLRIGNLNLAGRELEAGEMAEMGGTRRRDGRDLMDCMDRDRAVGFESTGSAAY